MQEFIAIGRLSKDVETLTTNNGTTVARFTLAVERNRANNNGEREADFFNTVVYGKMAENCGKYLKKGSQIAIVGSVQNRNYDAKDGTKRYITEIIAEKVNFLSTGSAAKRDTTSQSELTEIDGSSLPF